MDTRLPSNSSVRDRRSELRHSAETPARLDILGEKARSLDVILVDVSTRGMRVLTSEPIEADSAIRIHLGADQFLGEVTHSYHEGGQYLVGIALINVMRNAAEVSQRLNRILQAR